MDETRTAIYGWSYGGFASTMALEQDIDPEPVFKCGIAVAPVTTWRLYNRPYTESYMALPADNELHYNNTLLTRLNIRACSNLHRL